MDKMKKYIVVKNLFENSRKLIGEFKNFRILMNFLEEYKKEGLKAYREEKMGSFQLNNCLYQVTFDRLTELKIDVSGYPATLEQITK